MAQLMHFIPQELRPDLSKGALKQEPAEQPEEDKNKWRQRGFGPLFSNAFKEQNYVSRIVFAARSVGAVGV